MDVKRFLVVKAFSLFVIETTNYPDEVLCWIRRLHEESRTAPRKRSYVLPLVSNK